MTEPFPPDRPFTTADLAALGVTRHQLRSAVRSGAVRQLLYGVYVPGTWEDTPENRARAASVVLPPHCVLVDRTAASLHGIDVFDFAELDVPPDLEVVSVGGTTPTRRHGVLGGKRDLAPHEITTIGGVRVTTPVRTACDIGCLRGRRRAIGALDAFRAAFGLTELDLTRMLPRFARRRGVVQLRELIPLSTGDADSQPESWLRLDIRDEGYPMPAPQVWVWVPGWGRAKVENAYERLRIAVEYDGEEVHSADADRERDKTRREALRRAGWIIIVVRRDGLSGAGRDAWLAELAAAYAERAPTPLAKRVYARSPESGRPRRGRRG